MTAKIQSEGSHKARSFKDRRPFSTLKHLKNDEMAPILHLKTIAHFAIHKFMREKGIIQISPVILSPITDPLTPDSDGENVRTARIKYNGQELLLCQSMIFHKQLSLLTGVKGVYAISPNVRLEPPDKGSTGNHLFEFCQADFELAHVDMRGGMTFTEELFTQVFTEVKEHCKSALEELDRSLSVPQPPFPRFTSHDVKAEYGAQWEVKLSEDMQKPCWVTCHDREFYDKEDEENPGHFRNYDLIYPEGFGEALSGGEREYKYDRILKRLQEDGLPLHKFSKFLQVAKEGLVPSAGAGFGMERLIRFLSGKKHIKDVTLFPKVPGEQVCF